MSLKDFTFTRATLPVARWSAWLLVALLQLAGLPTCAAEAYSFGVLPQRSAVLTAQYWNPILEYVRRTSGIELVLRIARTGADSADAIERGEYDFVYSNHIFRPKVSATGYQVILRPRDDVIRGQIVVLEDTPARALRDLAGRPVGFPSAAAFVAYTVPMDMLLREGITVTPVFGGNQEGIMAQLKAGRVVAAAVNNQLMDAYAKRERLRYRVLWESVPYHNLPIAVHPRVPRAVAQAVKAAIDGMEHDADGLAVLKETAAVVGQKPPYGFQAATGEDYRNYTDFYARAVIKEGR